MGNFGLPDLDADRRQSFSYLANPLMAAQCCEGLRDRFVQRGRGHVERVGDLVQVENGDGAGPESHTSNLSLGSEEAHEVTSRWPSSAAQTARTVFPYAALAKIS